MEKGVFHTCDSGSRYRLWMDGQPWIPPGFIRCYHLCLSGRSTYMMLRTGVELSAPRNLNVFSTTAQRRRRWAVVENTHSDARSVSSTRSALLRLATCCYGRPGNCVRYFWWLDSGGGCCALCPSRVCQNTLTKEEIIAAEYEYNQVTTLTQHSHSERSRSRIWL